MTIFSKAFEEKVRHVRDAEFWHMPVGTPIVSGMKPKAPITVSAVRATGAGKVSRMKVKASDIKPGDYLDADHRLQVRRATTKNNQTTVTWKPLVTGDPGKQVFRADSDVFIYRASGTQKPVEAPKPTPRTPRAVAPQEKPKRVGRKPTIKPPQDKEPTPEQIDEVGKTPSSSERAVSDAAARASGALDKEIPYDGDEVETRTTYDIPIENLAIAKKLIERANKRAARARMKARFEYTVEKYEERRKNKVTGLEEVHQRAKIVLNRPTIAHDGWEFIGVMQWDPEAGLITRIAPGKKLNKRPEAKRCDACGLARDRIDTYIIRNKDGEEKQVGSNCLETFLGMKPGALWMLQWDDLAAQEGSGEGGSFGHREDIRYDPVNLLTYGLAVVQEYGWVPRSKADEYGRPASVDVMLDVLYPPMKESNEQRQFREKIIALASEKDVEAQEVLDFAKTMEGDNDYVINLRAVANAASVSMRNVALLVSAIAAKQRQDGMRAQREAQAAQSVHIGNVGDKITGVRARVVGVQYIDGLYGVTTLLTFVTPEGNVLKWFASGSKHYSIGDEINIDRATIKKHDEWKGVKQTQITRAKLTVVKSANEEAKAFFVAEYKDLEHTNCIRGIIP